jgi:hypothetical protein
MLRSTAILSVTIFFACPAMAFPPGVKPVGSRRDQKTVMTASLGDHQSDVAERLFIIFVLAERDAFVSLLSLPTKYQPRRA